MMFTKTMMALAVTIAFGAASVVPAASASKARTARQAKPQAPVQYQVPGVRPGQATRPDGGPHSPNPSYDVYVNGIYAGSDPDPRIRAYIANDPPWKRDP